MTYPASTNKLPTHAYVDANGTIAEAITIPSSPPYTHMLGQSAPANYPSGYQIVPPTTAGAVTVSGGGYGSWSQVTGSPAGGQFVVDTSTTATGGTITFSATDAGKSVTINWIGSLLPNEQWMEDIWNALHDIVSANGAASGFAMLDANGRVTAPASTTGPHVASSGGSTPTVTNVVSPANTGYSISGNDRRGTITFTTPASPSGGAQFQVTFASSYGTTPVVVVSPDNNVATICTLNRATTGFRVGTGGALAANTTFTISYIVED